MHRRIIIVFLFILLAIHGRALADAAPRVELRRVPDGGIQPQAVVDANGALHLIYFKGEAIAGDVFYRRSSDGGATWTDALRVNSEPDSVVAAGTMRGAHLAVGRGGRPHVAWMGSKNTRPPDADHHDTPMLYTRLNDQRDAFEPQRNVIREQYGLDGGGSVAADADGNVYVVWHAGPKGGGEQQRRVWVARSQDDGQTFTREVPAWAEPTGACGCCGVRATIGQDGELLAFYRTADDTVNRDMTIVRVPPAGGAATAGRTVDAWRLNRCPASTAAMAVYGDLLYLAWETQEQVYFQSVKAGQLPGDRVQASLFAGGVKHPSIAADPDGRVLVTWVKTTGWAQPGTLGWRLFDANGKPLEGQGTTGERPGVAAWSFGAAVTMADGSFVILY